MEHPAVLQACNSAVERGLAEGCHLLDNDEFGQIDLNQLRQVLCSERSISLVSVMLVNNETGVRFPLEEIAALCRQADIRCHTDATQAVGRTPLSFKDLDVDLASFSAHKMYGPMGIGGLYIHNRVEMASFLSGGHQERAIRPGTENLIGIIGFGAAAELAGDIDEEYERQQQLLVRLKQTVLGQIDAVVVNGEAPLMAPNVFNVSFLGCDAEALSIACDLEGLSISAGAACSVGSVETSHVIRAITDDTERRRSALRISLGRYTTEKDIDRAVAILGRCIERLRQS
jgi:cysteine desulfurase